MSPLDRTRKDDFSAVMCLGARNALCQRSGADGKANGGLTAKLSSALVKRGQFGSHSLPNYAERINSINEAMAMTSPTIS